MENNKEDISSNIQNKKLKKYEILKIPNEIIIKDHHYVFKKELSGNNFSYRCINRNQCQSLLTISRQDIEIIKNKKEEDIIPKINKTHTCSGSIIELAKGKDVITETDYIKLATDLINLNPEKSLGWHIHKFEEQKNPVKFSMIKKILYSIKQSKYPNDENFLSNIDAITITFDESNENLKNLPFCLCRKSFINFKKNNKADNFVIYSSFFQMKLFANSNEYYIDATFMKSPRKYYQTLNIICYCDNIKSNIPVMHIPMTSKNIETYDNVFSEILFICNQLKLTLNFNNKTIMCDFEKSLRESLKKNFKGIKIKGCFFHYVKCLWNKAKKIGIVNKKNLANTKIIIFLLKIIILIKSEFHVKIVDAIKQFIRELDNKNLYEQFLSYYEKNWLHTNFIKFDEEYDRIIKSRTNNICEGFHSFLNRLIEVNRPKNSLFVDKIKIIAINNYNKFINNFFNAEGEIIKKNDIFKDFYNYMTNFLKKYKNKFVLENFIKYCRDKNEDLNSICNSVLELLFDININNEEFFDDIDSENSDEKNKQHNYDINNSEDEISNADNSSDEDSSITTKINHCELSNIKSTFEDDTEDISGKRKSGFYEQTFFNKLYGI